MLISGTDIANQQIPQLYPRLAANDVSSSEHYLNCFNTCSLLTVLQHYRRRNSLPSLPRRQQNAVSPS